MEFKSEFKHGTKEYNHDYYIKHKNHLSIVNKEWVSKNRDKVRATWKRFYTKHKEEILGKQKQDKDKNRSRNWGYQKRWRRTPRGKELTKATYLRYVSKPGVREKRRSMVHNWWNTPKGRYQKCRIGAKNRNIDFKLTLEEFSKLWQKDCVYCGAKIATIGVDRVDSAGAYDNSNIAPCCTFCNLSKRDMTADQYREHLKRISEFYYKTHAYRYQLN